MVSQIGSVNDGTFKVTVKTTPAYGTGTGTNLSTAAYVSSGISWTALNRYWTIRATTQPTDSILVRFPWSGKDLSDATAINPAASTPGKLVFYTVDSPHLVFRVRCIHYQIPSLLQQQFANHAKLEIKYN
jgi:hypothetical protein